MDFDGNLQQKLRLREPGNLGEWRLWEHKTFNIHRGVLHWRPARGISSCAELSEAVRDQVRSSYRRSWWRGLGFGVLVETPTLPGDVASIDAAVDARENPQGVWQWTVLVCPPAKAAFGVHTWVEGYLSSVYREIVAGCESWGYATRCSKKEKDRLMQVLTSIARPRSIREFQP